jgi:hypothetical protein
MAGPFEDILKKEYRWPKRGDRIAQHISKATDAYISDVSHERAVFLWRGYFQAGKLLAEHCERVSFDVNYLVYPMMYNYRHALEVAMKELISEYGPFVDVEPAPDNNHNLLQLWGYFIRSVPLAWQAQCLPLRRMPFAPPLLRAHPGSLDS